MNKTISALLATTVVATAATTGYSVENTWDNSVRVSATVSASPAKITLTWPQDTNGVPSSYTIYRKAPSSTNWGTGTTLSGSSTSYVDTNVTPGTAYEYRIVKVANGYTGYGYIQAGVEVPLADNRGKVVLVVDKTHASALSSELTRLERDLAGDGWTVLRRDVNRTDSVASVKSVIKTAYDADPANVKAVFLFGRVPVPYSGNMNPDGHGDHKGAWPADAFYGDMDGVWTDNSVNYTQSINTNPGEGARLSNYPGDGKFDQSTLPSNVELMVGRVDFAKMPGLLWTGGPTTFPAEVDLLRQYLNKDHAFRHRVLNPQRRAIVGDYFGWRGGEAFSATAYGGFATFFGADKTLNLNSAYNDTRGLWVPELAKNDYLVAFGAGAGSYASIAGLGNAAVYNTATSPEIYTNNIKSSFNWVFGSWLGDWDSEDNFMRTILATKDYGLTAAWSGRPHWFMHPMGLGEPVGYAARLTKNNTGIYQNQVDSSARGTHIALMGDPTLRLHVVAPASGFSGTVSGSSAALRWTASAESGVVGYHVYRGTSASGPFTRLTSNPVSGTSYTDNSAVSNATYMVRAVKLETTASGSFYNASQGVFWKAGSVDGGGTTPPPADTTAPTVSLTAPTAGATVSGTVALSANASDNVDVVGVQFKVNGINVGSEDTTAPYGVSWNTANGANGSATVTAVARDAAGNTRTSSGLTVNVNNTSTTPTTPPGAANAWLDDAVPGGTATGNEAWTWVSANPAPYSGTKAHQSPLAAGLHEHAFNWASTPMNVAVGDSLYTYVYLDPANPPKQIMLHWNDGTWDHRAYWGANNIDYGTNGTASRLRVGDLPATGKWVRLEVPAKSVGLEGRTVSGMAFSAWDGQVTWDASGAGPATVVTPPADTAAPTVSLTAPAAGATISGASVNVTANAADNTGVAGVQFKLDGANLGSEDTTAPYAATLDTTALANGTHTLTAVARDAAGNTKTATNVSVTVQNAAPVADTTRPRVTLTAPAANATVSGKSVVLTATASDNVRVTNVNFKLNGATIGSDTTSPYAFTWDSTTVANGTYTLAATARDAAGNTRTSSVSVTVKNSATTPTPTPETPPASSNDVVFVDDALPGGTGYGSEPWTWVTTNPAPLSGGKAHQSALASGLHEHAFNWASTPLNVAAGDILVAHVFIDPANPPTQLMLHWNDGSSWDHRAYWGANSINYGVNGTASRLRVGDLPASGKWVRLEVPAKSLGLEGKTITGMAFSTYNGRVTWDKSGKSSGVVTAPVLDTTAPTISFTAPAAGATVSGTGVNVAATAADNVGVVGVQFKVDGANLGAEDATAPYATTLNTTTLANGTHTLTAVARDAAGNTRTTAGLSITVNNVTTTPPTSGGGTTTPPTSGGGTTTPPVTDGGTTTPTTPIGSLASDENAAIALPKVGDHGLTIVAPTVLELARVDTKNPDPATMQSWNFVSSSGVFTAPAASKFEVTVDGKPASIQSIGFRRRVRYAPLDIRDLRVGQYLYVQLATPVSDGQTVVVKNPDATLWPSSMTFAAKADPLRHSPAIHVNQEGYVPSFPKKAMVGYYLGNLGELNVASTSGFKLVNAATGATVHTGSLTVRADVGYNYTPKPYQKVLEADFSSFKTPGEYQLVVPGLGASLPFLIDDGIAMGFTRTYALGLYHQRCGHANSLPYTRHTHDACHVAKAEVPSPQSNYAFTWTTIASKNADTATVNPAGVGKQLKDEASQLYPFVNKGTIDVSGGHHDAGDYSKYTINVAQLVHTLAFTADSIAGAGALDNLGLPESGDGISDILQEAKHEADYLAKLQDADGGFYFIVYPKTREYEGNVTPDKGDTQVVWPKNTNATAAAVAALAQMASSPKFKAAYPAAASSYLAKAKAGWQFIQNGIAKHGKNGAYQKITFYGDNYIHNDEIAWAACELFLATGEAQYANALKEWFPNPADTSTMRWGWWRMSESWGNAIRSYAFAARSGRLSSNQLDSAYLAACENQIKLAGDEMLARSKNNAYGTSFPNETKGVMSAGWYFGLDYAADIAVAHQINPKADYVDALVSNMNYEAGSNPVNVAYLSGVGLKRQRENVNQYARNDRRALPPAGIPVGNIQAGYDMLPLYSASGNELSKLSFPSDGGSSNVYPFYDRWADTWNVSTEFITVNQARALMSVSLLAAQTPAKSTAWKSSTAAKIVAPTTVVPLDAPVTLSLTTTGLDLAGARILWEGRDQDPDFGPTFAYTPKSVGEQWAEAEIMFPDGRRIVATATFQANSPVVKWVDEAVPAGAWTNGNESWNWTSSSPTPYSGTKAHTTSVVAGLHEHAFNDASSPLVISAGDKLFAYVYLDPANPPSQIMLHWCDTNGSWDHRAYWGADSISYGTPGTASRYKVGALPAAGGWVKLEVPASAVGLEGKSVKGMCFSAFGGRVTWDVSGKSSQ